MPIRYRSSTFPVLILALGLPLTAAHHPHRTPRPFQAKPIPCVERCYKNYFRCVKAVVTMACKNYLEACIAACDDE